MKKKLAVIIAVIMIFAMGSLVIACNLTPTQLDTPVISINGSTISWTAVDNADKYVVYKGETELATVTETSYVINESTPGKYEFRVMAKSDNENYTDSELSEKVTYEVKGKSDDATQLATPVIKLEGAVISWTAVANADKYVVYKDGTEVTTVTATQYTIQETEEGTYKFTVRAKSDNQNYSDSELSNEVSYTVEGKSDNETQLAAPVIKIEGAVISWTAVANADKYVVYKNGTEAATVEETQYTIQETEEGTYKFTVKATSDNENYTDSKLSNEVEYTVAPSEVASVKLSQLIKSIDLTKGLKLDGEFDISVLASLIDEDSTETYERITGELLAAMLIAENEELNLDFELDANRALNNDKAKLRAYIRGNRLYAASVATENGEEIISDDDLIYDYNSNISSGSDMNVNAILVGILGNISKLGDAPLVRYLDSKVVFTKNGNSVETKIDVIDILSKLIKKIETVLGKLTDKTTLSELYTEIGGKEILDAVFGDTTLQELYTQIRSFMPPNDDEIHIPYELDGEQGFIKYIQVVLEQKGMVGELPQAGDSTVSQYMDKLLGVFGDRTLDLFADFILNFGSGQSGVVANDAATDGDGETSVVEQLKQTIMGFITPIKTILPLNTLKFTIGADAAGNLTSISAEIKIEQSIMALFGGSSSGSTFAVDDNNGDDDTTPVYIIEATASISFTHGNITFKTVDDLKTLDSVMQSHLGNYTCSSVELKLDGEAVAKEQYEAHNFTDCTNKTVEIKVEEGDYIAFWQDAEFGEYIHITDGELCASVNDKSGRITFEADGSITITGVYGNYFEPGTSDKEYEELEFVVKLEKVNA